jgi:galactokinase
MREEVAVSAPGRICLFGEHQDYFGLPIIAAAINLRIHIQGRTRKERTFKILLPDIRDEEKFSLDEDAIYNKERDYLRSAFNVLRRTGCRYSSGWECLVQGSIPINAGTSSSSALVVAWIKFLLEAARDQRAQRPGDIAELGYLAEVAEFNEPGGKMDHYASSLGGIVSVTFDDTLRTQKLKNPLQKFILADSLQKKDTTGMLGYIKSHVLKGVASIRKKVEGFSLKSPMGPKECDQIEKLPPDNKRLLKGTLLTRDLTTEGRALFEAEEFDHARFGTLLNQQQEVLRRFIRTSTPKIEKMIEAAIGAGALGAKINGSGGGGCMFAYAPERTEEIAEAVESVGAKVHIIHVDEGVRAEN